MRALRLPWSRACSLVCEVPLRLPRSWALSPVCGVESRVLAITRFGLVGSCVKWPSCLHTTKKPKKRAMAPAMSAMATASQLSMANTLHGAGGISSTLLQLRSKLGTRSIPNPIAIAIPGLGCSGLLAMVRTGERNKGWRHQQLVRCKSPEVQKDEEEGLEMPANAPKIKGVEQLVGGDNRGVERIFSNLNQATLKHEPGSLSSAVLLIAGTTVGAGILAIPSVTQESGFLASSVACIGCWLYMVGTGLLVAEVNVNTMCELGSGGVSLVSMAMRTLGVWGVRVACGAYLFIHYALLVAYIARSSDIVTNFAGTPLWLSAALFTGGLGGLCFFGSQRVIGLVNGALVVGILGSFGVLVGVASGGLDYNSLLRANFAAVPHSIPVIALAFVYQNVVPVISTNLEGDLPRIRTAVVLGTAIPLVMFLIWDAVILGTTSTLVDANGAVQAVSDPLISLRATSGIVGPTVELFSFLAVATSFIGFVLGLTDFLCDLLKLPGGGRRSPLPYLLTLFPPCTLALTSPDVFYQALDFAGTYGVLVLFGVLPAAMAWSERYSDTCLPPTVQPIVPGGKITLAFVIGAAGFIITSEAVSKLFH